MRVTHHRRLGCFWAACLVLATLARAEELAPRAVVDSAVHDFGTVEQGARVDHVFRIRNRGSGELRVDHVKGTCACTVGAATGEPIRPGEEAWVTLMLDTTTLAGRTTKTATVYTNDPVEPALAVTLTGVVLTDLVFHPSALYLGHVAHGTTARRELVVSPGRPGGTATVVRADPSSHHLKAWVEPADGGAQRVVVELMADAPAGRFHDEVVLRTTSAARPSITVKVFGTVEGGEPSADGTIPPS